MLFLIQSVDFIAQTNTIYCIKHSYFHQPNIHDSITTPFIRTLWFDICTENFSVSKSWQYNCQGKTELQMVSYKNQFHQQSIDLTWEKETENKKEHYHFELIGFDTLTNFFYTFNADIQTAQINRIYLETWQQNENTFFTEVYQINNDSLLIEELQNWMINDRYSKDSLSIPPFFNLMVFEKVLTKQNKETTQLKHSGDFKPEANSFDCEATAIPDYIKKYSKLIKKEKGIYEKRYQKEDDIETYYEIFFKQ